MLDYLFLSDLGLTLALTHISTGAFRKRKKREFFLMQLSSVIG
jgi:hypothetical protein